MWKGKTRGGVSGYLFFIYLIRYCGVKAAYGFLSLIVLFQAIASYQLYALIN